MTTKTRASVSVLILALVMTGCSDQSKDKVADFGSMPDEQVKDEVLRLKGSCRQSQEDPSKAGSPCNQLALAERAAETKGWCWGPQAAVNVDMSWMRCEDDVTGTPQAQGTWFASTTSGACRETTLDEAISKVFTRDGQWNVKTWFSPEGVFNVSSRSKEGDVSSIQLFGSCGAALMAHITHPERPDVIAVAAPLGFSLKDAGTYFGFGARNCSGGPVGRTIGCMMAFTDETRAPITMTGGFTPCAAGRTVQFDFDPRRGLVGVTCAASAETQAALRSKMNEAFGEAKKLATGSFLWEVGDYSVKSSEGDSFGQTLRTTSVFVSR